MRKEAYLIGGTAALLVVATLLGAGLYARSQKQQKEAEAASRPPPPDERYIRPHSHVLGPADAKVTVVEFLDPECESCRAMYPIVKKLLSDYGGRVRLVVRYLPLHPNSMFACSALEAAAEQGRYWEMLESLFVNQPLWGDHAAPNPALIPEFAKQVGLDMDAFGKALSRDVVKQRLELDRADAQALGATGTPTFFVNGKMLERLGYEPLKALIDEALAR